MILTQHLSFYNNLPLHVCDLNLSLGLRYFLFIFDLSLKTLSNLLKKGWLREPYNFMHPHIQGDYKETIENNLIKIREGEEMQ